MTPSLRVLGASDEDAAVRIETQWSHDQEGRDAGAGMVPGTGGGDVRNERRRDECRPGDGRPPGRGERRPVRGPGDGAVSAARRGSRDPMGSLRQARDELRDIDRRSYQHWRAGIDAIGDLSAPDLHRYLSERLEEAHAHMVGAAVAERALTAAYAGPRPALRDRVEANAAFIGALHDYCRHKRAFPDEVRSVADWIKDFGRPQRPAPDRTADVEAER
jgi:hypothetical protein